ncbi:MAG: lipocalin family protein [Gammaproteobacteria bacterium]|nr:lipocalin family protein [Gammaproteobacteria bacterium]
MTHRSLLASLLLLFSMTACVSIPEGINAVKGFELDRYLGTWYEIARLDHRFERGLQDVTATYSLREDGGVRVLNRGFDTDDGEWQEAEGKAFFVVGPDVGRFKVSFFGPFYGGYNIFELDKQDYQYAMIAGDDRSYLWILSRTPVLAPEIREQLLNKARQEGFNVEGLIFVSHERAS